MDNFSRPGLCMAEHPSLKCFSKPVPSLLPPKHFDLVLAHLSVIEFVDPTYWYLPSGCEHSFKYINHRSLGVCVAFRWIFVMAMAWFLLKWLDKTLSERFKDS